MQYIIVQRIVLDNQEFCEKNTCFYKMKKSSGEILLDITGGCSQHLCPLHWKRRLLKPWGLLYSAEGSGSISLKDDKFDIPHRSLLIYKPGYAYTFHSNGYWKYIWFHFPVRSHIRDILSFHEVMPGLGCFTLENQELEKITGNLDEICELEYYHRNNWEELALNLIENTLLRVCMINSGKSTLSRKSLDLALKMLTSDDCPSMEEIARRCGVSVSTFYTTFARELGCSPRSYREQHQLRNARNLLLNSDHSLEEIAEICGFCNRYYMSDRFRKVLGVTPGALRKNRQL